MTGSMKKLINNDVYEKNADRPWAKFRDFIFTDDGMAVRLAVLSTVSIIPILYTVDFNAFECIFGRAVLKEGTKPVALKPQYDELKSFEKIKKKKMFPEGKVSKLLDVYFDTEIGEITDFVTVGSFYLGKRIYTPDEAGFFVEALSD